MKKIIAIILSAVLVCGVFTACSGANTGKGGISYTYDSYYSDADKNVLKEYESLCDAIVKGQPEASVDIDYIDSINRIYYTSFPLSILVKKMSLNDKEGRISLEYVNDAETHRQLVEAFTAKVNQIMTDCGYGEVSDFEYILRLYTYIASNTTLNSQANSTYDVIVNSFGSQQNFSAAFEYLLLQAGIYATHIYGLNSKGVSFMTIAQIDGEKFIFAPYSEYKANKGNGLSFFAMTYSDVLELGFTEGFRYTNDEAVVFDDASEKYSPLRDTVSYEYENSVLTVVKSNGEKIEFKTK